MKLNNRVLKVNLSDLSGREMSNREKMSLKGGDVVEIGSCCSCGCCYMGEPGGSSWTSNEEANLSAALTTLCEGNTSCWELKDTGETGVGWVLVDSCSPA